MNPCADRNHLIAPGERADDLQRGGYYILQNPKRFCFGIDAVLLSGFAEAHARERVLDLGTGTGVIPVLMRARYKSRNYTGLEIDPEMADMARRSVIYNGLQDCVQIVQGDLKQIRTLFPAAGFDVVTSNPPYMPAGHGKVNDDSEHTVSGARHELWCTLEDVISAASYALREQGRFYMVHRPFRLAEIIKTLSRYRLEVKRLRLVYPKEDREPNMVLVEARKGGAEGMKVLPPLIVYDREGAYTKEIMEIYYGE